MLEKELCARLWSNCPRCYCQAARLHFTECIPAACSYAARARKIKNKPTKNTNQLSKLREEMAALRDENRRLQVTKAHRVVKLSLHGHVKQKHGGWPSAGPAQPSLYQVRQVKCCQLTLQPAHGA